MRAASRAPAWVLLAMLVGCAYVLFGPWWTDAAGENPLQRPPGPDYPQVVRLAAPTVVLALTLILTMLWAAVRARGGARDPGRTLRRD